MPLMTISITKTINTTFYVQAEEGWSDERIKDEAKKMLYADPTWDKYYGTDSVTIVDRDVEKEKKK